MVGISDTSAAAPCISTSSCRPSRCNTGSPGSRRRRRSTDFTGFDIWNLRGHATDFSALIPKILGRIRDTGYSLILIDPIYKGLGARNENDAGDIASLLNEVEQLAAKSGAAAVFGAHFSKGNQAGKESIDRIGGSGVFARDPDVILTMTPHEEDDAHVIDLTLRALPPVKPFVVRWCESIFITDRKPILRSSRLPRAIPRARRRRPPTRWAARPTATPAPSRTMPPLANGKVPQESAVLAYVSDRIAEIEGDCTLKEAQRVFYCLANMKKGSPFVFDKATRLWRGRRHGI